MNRKWIEEQLNFLFARFKDYYPSSRNFFFEPTQETYVGLESGDEKDLNFVVSKISQHIGLSEAPLAKYDWSIKLGYHIAGQAIIDRKNQINIVRVPFKFVGNYYAIGSIIAHEMSHFFLFSKELVLNDEVENEKLTDLMSVFLGLGKLMLNGKVLCFQGADFFEEIGYIPFDLILYAYIIVCKQRKISFEYATTNLKPEVVAKLKTAYY
ncbi:MAG: hypothetical protein QW735_04155 [archaeon]